MIRGLRALLVLVLSSGCAHEPAPVQSPKAREATLVVPFNAAQCERLRDEGRFRMRLRGVEAEKVLQTLADATCFTFAIDKGLQATLTLQPSEDEPAADWTWSEFFNAVRTELERQGVLFKEEGARRYRVSAVR